MLATLKTKLNTISNYLSGGYNLPTEEQINKAPLVMKEKEYKPLFSEKEIDEAKESTPFGLRRVRVKGLLGFLNGSYNTPKISKKEEMALNEKFHYMPELFLRYGKRHYNEYWLK